MNGVHISRIPEAGKRIGAFSHLDPGARVEKDMEQLMATTAAVAPGVLLGVNAPFQQLHFRGAAGNFCREDGPKLEPGHAFRIASMSKTFTGLLCAQRIEQGQLSLQTPAIELLPATIAARLPVAPGHHREEITLEHLLYHRAGFNDFALSEDWFQVLAGDPGKFRAPAEIAEWALDNAQLVGAPGATYHYSDTGYVLLGLLLEQLTATSYAQLCRQRIFDPLGMDETYLEGHEPARGQLSHCYIHLNDEYIDALQINGSCDWAAGGHVSTLDDLDRFLRGTFSGKLTTQPATLDSFLSGKLAQPGYHYAMGIGRKVIHGKTLWGHLGHWGSFMYYCPEERLSLSGTLNYDGAQHNAFLEQLLRIIFP
jgi:D-alanyl-D-alanine carboxypeptidase